jgi:hypothetical protein
MSLKEENISLARFNMEGPVREDKHGVKPVVRDIRTVAEGPLYEGISEGEVNRPSCLSNHLVISELHQQDHMCSSASLPPRRPLKNYNKREKDTFSKRKTCSK